MIGLAGPLWLVRRISARVRRARAGVREMRARELERMDISPHGKLALWSHRLDTAMFWAIGLVLLEVAVFGGLALVLWLS